MDRWTGDIDKLIRLDKIGASDIRAVIEWATKDKFWQENILSGEKLRKHFDKLFLQAKRASPKTLQELQEDNIAESERLDALAEKIRAGEL